MHHHKSNIIATSIEHYLVSDLAIFLFCHNSQEIIVLELDNLQIVNKFPLRYPLHPFSKPELVHDKIYIPTKHNGILVIDSISGEQLDHIDLGAMYITSQLIINDSVIQFLVAIPVSKNSHINLNKFSLITIDKKNTNRKTQSCFYESGKCYLSKNDKPHSVIITTDSYVYICNIYGMPLRNASFGHRNDFQSIFINYNKYIVSGSRNGLIKIVDTDKFDLINTFKTKDFISDPIVYSNNLYCLRQQEIIIIPNIITQSDTTTIPYLLDLQVEINSKEINIDNSGNIYLSTNTGSILSINANSFTKKEVKLNDSPLNHLKIQDNKIYAIAPFGKNNKIFAVDKDV